MNDKEYNNKEDINEIILEKKEDNDIILDDEKMDETEKNTDFINENILNDDPFDHNINNYIENNNNAEISKIKFEKKDENDNSTIIDNENRISYFYGDNNESDSEYKCRDVKESESKNKSNSIFIKYRKSNNTKSNLMSYNYFFSFYWDLDFIIRKYLFYIC